MTTLKQSVELHVYEELSEVPLDEQSWDQLVSDAGIGGVFLQHFWVHTWWHFYGRSYDLFFVTAEVDGRVVGFAPMMIDGSRTVRIIGDANADYLGFVIPKDDTRMLESFIDFLSKSRDRWDVIHLRNIRRDAPAPDHLMRICREARLKAWNNYTVAAPLLTIAGNENEVATLLRKESLRRSERLLEDQGELRYEVFVTDDRADTYWEMFSTQHIVRCRQANRPSNFSDPDYLLFLKALFKADRTKTRVHFSALFVDERPVAFHFGFISQRCLLWYKPSFDIGIRQGSPGTTLTCFLIRFARDNGLDAVDFTIGDEPFKDRFCNQKHLVDEFRIHKSTAAYLLDAGYRHLRRSLKRLIRRRE